MPNTVRLHRVLAAKPEKIYRAFLEADAMAKWLPPNGFAATVHHLEAKVGEPSGCRSGISPPATATRSAANMSNSSPMSGCATPTSSKIPPGWRDPGDGDAEEGAGRHRHHDHSRGAARTLSRWRHVTSAGSSRWKISQGWWSPKSISRTSCGISLRGGAHRSQHCVNLGHDGGALAYGRCDAFRGTGADVADREYAGDVRLQGKRQRRLRGVFRSSVRI